YRRRPRPDRAAQGDRRRARLAHDLARRRGRGGRGAWAIAQHADHDPEFQEQALELIREAVARGDASPGNLAYLTDRVAVGKGEPQTYGTQVGCTADGEVQVAPLADEDSVDERRAEVGLGPLDDYLAEMARICAQDAGTSSP